MSVVEVNINDDKIYRLIEQTNTDNPSPEAVQALRKVLHEMPDVWSLFGDLARHTQDQIVEGTMATKLIKESLSHGIKEMRRELGFEEAPPLERLLIEQVLLTWLHYYRTQHNHVSILSRGATFAQATHWEKRLNGAQRRHLRAIETLARVRKLSGRGPIQINIAEQQVNVAS